MASDTVTPDEYQVNADGARVENGIVMARTLEENTIEGEVMLPIMVQARDQEFEAELYDSETARELISRFPMTIAMKGISCFLVLTVWSCFIRTFRLLTAIPGLVA